MSGLNPRQRAAVKYIDGPLLVLAGAGSGKTRVIIQKIIYLIRECGYAPKNIAAVTFTNKAAREMKQRLREALGKDDSRGLAVSTFHTLGLNIIRREHAQLGYKAAISIYDTQDCLALLKELMNKAFSGDDNVAQMQQQISMWKNALIDPQQAQQLANGDPILVAASVLFEEYDRVMQAYNAVDFDDLIRLPVRLFQQHPEVLDKWQNRIRYLLVDEYQDTNLTQYRLVQMLVGARGALTVVGDDDQSIYAWRGAHPENLAQLQQDFPRLNVIKLEQNYRSTGCILKAANQLITNNHHVFEKALWSELGFGEPIRILETRDEEHEAERVTSSILHHKFQHNTRYRDYAILYRGNHQSRLFERHLREYQIPYRITGGPSFFNYTEVKDLLAYLRLVVNPDDDAAFLRVINTPRREIGPTTVEKLARYATERGVSLVAAGDELGLEQVLPNRAVQHLRYFVEWLATLSDRALRGDVKSLLDDLIKDINYDLWLQDSSRDTAAYERKMENVQELVNWIHHLFDTQEKEPSLAELVSRLQLMDILDRDEQESDQDGVHLMTLHGAKGLEFPHVYLVGVEEDLLPHHVSIDEDGIEEERRLAYVGITRAQRSLTLSYAVRRKRGGEYSHCEPSRFIAELPEDTVRREGGGSTEDPEVRQQRGRAHLENLRGLLN